MTNRRVPAQKAMAEAFLAWLQAPDAYGNADAMARRLGVEYVIWNNRMWRAYDPGRGWTEYDNCLHKKKKGKRAWANACHRTHVHISLSWDGAYLRTSYFSGFVVCRVPALAGAGPAALARSTLRGGHVHAHPEHADRTWYAGRPVPGPWWHALRPAGPGPGRRADHRCGRGRPAGRPAPGRLADELARLAGRGRPARRPGRDGEPRRGDGAVTVPVGANGMISLQHSAGMSQLTADVVGYHSTQPAAAPVV